MRIEDCIVAVERRSGGSCLDLALLFTYRFAGPIWRLWITFAVPSCLLTWWLSENRTDLLLITGPMFVFFSSCMAATLVATVGPQVFGVPLSTASGVRTVLGRIFAFGIFTALIRALQLALGTCLLVPALLPSAMAGHLYEVLFLERTPVSGVSQRLSALGRGGGTMRNLQRLCGFCFLWVVCTVGLFIMLDQLLNGLFQIRVFEGTLFTGPGWLEALTASIADDRDVMLLLQLCAWVPLPILRLAWFFCYLDQRIRNECWDLDLQFRAEATRLQGGSP